MPQPVLTDIQTRLEASRETVRDLREALSAELKRRDALVVDAIDAGANYRAAATWSGVTSTRVVAIVCVSEPNAVLPR